MLMYQSLISTIHFLLLYLKKALGFMTDSLDIIFIDMGSSDITVMTHFFVKDARNNFLLDLPHFLNSTSTWNFPILVFKVWQKKAS